MLPIDITGDRVVDLSILFGLLTVGVGVIVLIMYLVFSRLVRSEQGGPPPLPSKERGDAPDTPPQTAEHGTADPRPGR